MACAPLGFLLPAFPGVESLPCEGAGKTASEPSILGLGLPGGLVVKNPPADARDTGSIPGWEDPLEKEMATHSSILAWRIPRTEEAGGLQSMGSHRAGHD